MEGPHVDPLALELRLDPDANESRVQREIQEILGESFIVKNRIQQNELLYKTMKSEKWAIFFILCFILLVASFNVVGSLTMLIIEKKNDIGFPKRHQFINFFQIFRHLCY